METNLLVRASFVTNKFLAIDGSYNGLFAPTNHEGQTWVAATNSGFLSLTLTDRGRFSGRLILGSATYSFTGGSDLAGQAQVVITPANQSPLVVVLSFDLDGVGGNDGVVGTVSRDGWVATLRAVPAAAARSLAGKYTFLIPGGPAVPAATEPAGVGAATATLTPAGVLTVSGALGDGTALNSAIPVSEGGEWPLFKSLHGGRGLVWGWVQFSTHSPQMAASNVHWIKPAGVPLNALYTNGFAITRSLVGARYLTPPAGSNAVTWPTTNGIVFLDGGNLSQSQTNQVGVARNRITVLAANPSQLGLNVAPGNGAFSGSFRHPATGRITPLKGVVLQLPSPDGSAGGWFKGTNESGSLRLEYLAPAP